MARSTTGQDGGGSDDISIIGPEMKVEGDMVTEGTVRVEGRIEGNVDAGKAVVVGRDVRTQDAVVSGRVLGGLTAASRLEVQATARIDGEVHARRLQLEEGAMLNGTVRMGEIDLEKPSGERSDDGSGPTAEG